ncbi:MAG: FAD:protein FMN transferase [Elusimicrobiaceae bacterium]|nr:FAD:protein FMN transferase [Elusimicrobiaceae bacterium]
MRAEVRVSGAADEGSAVRLSSAVFSEWRRLEKKFGYYDAASEISRLNGLAGVQPVAVDPETFGLLAKGLELSSMTGGRFDITFTPVWELWRQCARHNRLPSDSEIADALELVDFNAVVLDSSSHTVRFTAGVSVNLGGIMREYALRRAAAVAEPERNGAAVMCSLGGDIAVLGERSKPWKFGIQNPENEGRLAGTVSFTGGFVVTTGAFERFVEINGRRYCHIIDARTGRPVEGVSSVTAHFPDIGRSYPSSVVFLLGAAAAEKALRLLPGASFVYQSAGVRPYLYRPAASGAEWTIFPQEPKSGNSVK